MLIFKTTQLFLFRWSLSSLITVAAVGISVPTANLKTILFEVK